MDMNTAKLGFQKAGLRLCFALILGLLVVPGYVVAPLLFAELDSAQAGHLAGKMFHLANVAMLILAAAAMVFCKRIGVTKRIWQLLLAVALFVAANEFGVATMIAMIKTEAGGSVSLLADDDPMRWMFGFWHGLGSVLQLIATLLMVALVMKRIQPDSSGDAA